MRKPEQTLQALAVSPGIAIGRACQVKGGSWRYEEPVPRTLAAAEIEPEIARFRQALEETRCELSELQKQLKEHLNSSEADIFDAHLLLLADARLLRDVEKHVREEAQNAAFAFYTVIERYATALARMPDEYLRERAVDIRDVAARVLGHLNHERREAPGLDDRRILAACELTPSETAILAPHKVLGFVLENGSATSHTAILARSMRLPALVGVSHEVIEKLSVDDKLIVDGYGGRLILNPEPRTEEAYRLKAAAAGKLYSDLQRDSTLEPETRDGFRVELALNLESAEGLPEMKTVGATGVGLFRTEYLYLGAEGLPDEEAQFAVYKALLVAAEEQPVVVRTLDVGGDKLPGSIYFVPEANPFLGLRGVRLCLYGRPDLFRTQLRALLRAGVFGNLKVMLPMVSTVEEITETKALIAELQKELTAEKAHFTPRLSLGAMIETPAAVLQIEQLAREVDFFSIGTNDLVQYTMAADRGNERVAYLQQMSHPVILGMIDRCIRAAHKHHIWCGVCGQMAAEPLYTPFLLGMGVHELSMDPNSIGLVRRVIRSLFLHEAEAAVAEALECRTAAETLAVSRRLLERVAPEVISLLSSSGN